MTTCTYQVLDLPFNDSAKSMLVKAKVNVARVLLQLGINYGAYLAFAPKSLNLAIMILDETTVEPEDLEFCPTLPGSINDAKQEIKFVASYLEHTLRTSQPTPDPEGPDSGSATSGENLITR